jgi:sodium/potassium-transporting ATPase subunit beta
MADKKPAMLGATAFKPVERHGMEAISWFLYDKNTGAIMGRTCKSWALITAFYIVYYAFLVGFWAICFTVFWNTTIDYDRPRWLNKDGRIGESPGIGVRPSQTWAHMDSGMFVYNHQALKEKEKIEGYGGWVKRAQEFLDQGYWKNDEECKAFECKNLKDEEKEECEERANNCWGYWKKLHEGGGIKSNMKMLDWKNGIPTPKSKIETANRDRQFYHFDKSQLGECTKENGYGFAAGKPCILLKLNKIFGVTHTYFNNVTIAEAFLKKEDLPGLPKKLKDHINTEQYQDHVWVDCHGENPFDEEMLGEVKYYPESRGFSSVFYPFENAAGYQSPLVAVQFLGLQPGILYHIECRAYAENIKYDRNDREGKAHFEILVHNSTTVDCVYGNDRCGNESME